MICWKAPQHITPIGSAAASPLYVSSDEFMMMIIQMLKHTFIIHSYMTCLLAE